MPTLPQARIHDTITRAEMAKMIAVYATKILHKQPDTTKVQCMQFSDKQKVNAELQGYLTLVCQLGLMGYQANGSDIQPSFRPNNFLTRAEVGVLLSRLLRGTTYAGTETQWYQSHLQALRTKDIMHVIDDPMMQELRGNALIMLKRIPA
jgi:hypothetical protein